MGEFIAVGISAVVVVASGDEKAMVSGVNNTDARDMYVLVASGQ